MFENTPCCDDCWWNDNGTQPLPVNGRGVIDDGTRLPYRFKNERRELERCHFCGFTTFSGIYIRTNVNETPAAEPREREALGT